jgi:two-component system phosphate regulon response regulator PhoB
MTDRARRTSTSRDVGVSDPPANRPKIAVIDDEPDVLDYVCVALDDHGYATCRLNDAKAAIDVILSERPDLVCLDLLMPERTGLALSREMCRRPETREMPVLIITGLSIEAEMDRLLNGLPRPAAVLEKPIELKRLLQTVHALLDTRSER